MQVFKKPISTQFKYLKTEWSEDMMDMFIIDLDMSELNFSDIKLKSYGNLRELNLSNNFISHLNIQWPPLLQILYLNGNNITQILSIPPQIVVLGLSFNNISNLCNMPESLRILDVRGNNIALLQQFDKCPQSLLTLYCTENPIELIDNFQGHLQKRFMKAKINKMTHEISNGAENILLNVQITLLSKMAEYLKISKSAATFISFKANGLEDFSISIKECIAIQKKKENSIIVKVSVLMQSLQQVYKMIKLDDAFELTVSLGKMIVLCGHANLLKDVEIVLDQGLSLKLRLL